MKILKTTIIVFFSFFLINCSNYGEKLQFEKTEVYYTDNVNKEEAEKLGNFLVNSGFAGENKKSVQLSKNKENGNYQFRMVTTKEAAESKTYETIFKYYAKQISDSVFDKKPVEFHVCDNVFKTLKVIPFKDEDNNTK